MLNPGTTGDEPNPSDEWISDPGSPPGIRTGLAAVPDWPEPRCVPLAADPEELDRCEPAEPDEAAPPAELPEPAELDALPEPTELAEPAEPPLDVLDPPPARDEPAPPEPRPEEPAPPAPA